MKKDQLGQDVLEQYKKLGREMELPKSMAAGQFMTNTVATSHIPASYYTASAVHR